MKLHIGIVVFFFLSLKISAQETLLPFPKPPRSEVSNDTVSKSPIDVHVSLGTEIMVRNHNTSSLFWISPDISYQLSPKVVVRTGFTYGTDLFGSSKYFPQSTARSLAPLKNQKKDFVNVYGRVEFMPNDRLWIATTISYQNGLLPNPYSPYSLSGMNADIFSANAEIQYRIGDHSFLYFGIGFSQIDYSGYRLESPHFYHP